MTPEHIMPTIGTVNRARRRRKARRIHYTAQSLRYGTKRRLESFRDGRRYTVCRWAAGRGDGGQFAECTE